jgi:8-amino-7-oxononanoate synthase
LSGALRHLGDALLALEREGLLRGDRPISRTGDEDLVVLCSNDYLGYGAEPWPRVDAPTGAGASRLIFGDHPQHRSAEAAIAAWIGTEAALLFSSGYAANVGALTALAGAEDVIVSDALNHASIIDGCRLSGAQVVVTPHLDAGAVEKALQAASAARRRWVVTESYFSMDGDIPNLTRLKRLSDEYDAGLMVDEAHAIGVFGPRGAGLCAEVGVVPDVFVGTLGKAIGLQGAFVAGSAKLRHWLWNRARSFVFSTGVSPALAEVAIGRVHRIATDDEARRRLENVGASLRQLVERAGGHIASSRGPILPWIFGGTAAAVGAAATLEEHGLLVRAIRPPTVPVATARLRITASAALGADALRRTKAALAALGASTDRARLEE